MKLNQQWNWVCVTCLCSFFFPAKQSSSLSKFSSCYLLVLKSKFLSESVWAERDSLHPCWICAGLQMFSCVTGFVSQWLVWVVCDVCTCPPAFPCSSSESSELPEADIKLCICITLTSPIFFFPIALPFISHHLHPHPRLSLLQTWCGAPSLLNDESNNVSGFPWALLPLRNHLELAFSSCPNTTIPVSGFHLNLFILRPQWCWILSRACLTCKAVHVWLRSDHRSLNQPSRPPADLVRMFLAAGWHLNKIQSQLFASVNVTLQEIQHPGCLRVSPDPGAERVMLNGCRW